MEKQKLPNATISLVLAILSYIGCCFWGLPGIITAIIAIVLANKDKAKYLETPELYNNYGQVKTARIIAIIGLVLSVLVLLTMIFVIVSFGGIDAYMEEIQRMQQEMQMEV
ncbi:uncharacterized protein with PQ loop repeat [Mesonia hippocampi]|uniref:Uncharacterized protein with PQ loop repeat n=1 Tax=Mesonia hippocampi TaxID=1628250 RepID=A0A840EIN8_9FLAO|nr:CCC motif membrane protein [Mesonia hippocampi]MBB4119202.1 uncharacterized protein with PQ loop repeat [Mesonia hippocampi]